LDHSTLRGTIALLEAALESTHDGILVVDLNRRIVRYNPQFLAMFGFTTEMLERDGVDGIIAALRPQIEGGDALGDRVEYLWAHADREIFGNLRFKDGRVFEAYVAPPRAGSSFAGLVASFREVSKAARAEQALEQHRAFLEKAQEVAHVGSWVTNLADNHVGWSRETHRIFGVPDGEFAGSLDAFFALVYPDDRETVRAASNAAINDRVPYDIEHRILRGDGTIRWVHEKADVIDDAEGRAVRLVGTVQDITERRLLEEQLRQSQKMEAIGRLAGGIAHDLNNALTTIAGYAELAIGQLGADTQARADVQEIRQAAERASSVTKQLLAFSRKQLLEPRVFSLNETVAAIGRLLSRLLGASVQVQSKMGADVPPILGDPGQIDQAIINLAVNARDAMPEGGQLILEAAVMDVDEAFARAHVPMPVGRYAMLRVSDTGHGMSRETQNRIFEPFFTTKDVGKGTGLGLSMVYGTLKQVGGFIFVDSEIGRGTTFSLFFPPAPMHTVTVPQPPVEERKVQSHETLLVVEDETAVRNLVASSLRNEGYRLLLASSAEEALAIAEVHRGGIDLLLTDAVMPGQSGIELARQLVTREPGLPVILMSGYTEETVPTQGGLEPAMTLLPKPFTPRDLRQRIRAVLDRRSPKSEV
jgi:PAS domain S-box-containing protein